jgi:serine/threonine protein kinase/tetratricopeptide (TPR) repeat protein
MATTSGPQPRVIAHYRLTEQIGAGGMGMVYRAHDERLNREVAVKLLPPADQSDTTARQRFRNEASALTRLNHPNTATVFDFGTASVDGEEVDYLVLELIPGTTLEERIQRSPIENEEAIDFAIQMLRGLTAAHAQNILHRDLKPSNIRISPDGHLKILDFGLAKVVQQDTADNGTHPLDLTSPGCILGTLPYMAPEQLRGEPCDFRSDIYSAGAVLFEMTTGRRPFPELGAKLTDAILNNKPSVPSALNRSLEPGLDAIILKALEKKPSLRYQSAREMLVDCERLRSVAHGREPIRPSLQSGRRWILPLAILVAVLAILPIARRRLDHHFTGTSATQVKTLAVLPLRPIGPEAANDFLGLGLTDSIINKLSRTQLLIVRPFSTVRRFAANDVDALNAAHQLDVDSVLDGTVQKSGVRLRVSINLLRTADGSSLWADSFDVHSDDIFNLQEQVAAQVVAKLGRTLAPDARQAITKRYTSNAEAYANYVKGKYYLDQASTGPAARAVTGKAEEYLNKAIELDPDYALARAQLAFVYAWNGLFVEPNTEWIEKAKAELAVAEKLDPELATIHAVRHQIAWSRYQGFDLLAAGQELRKAEALDPDNASELAIFYAHLGSAELAQAAIADAARYAPSDSVGARMEANWLLGNYESAVALCSEESKSATCHPASLARLGRLDEGLRDIEQELRESPGDPQRVSTKAVILAATGKRAEADELVTRTLAASKPNRAYHHVAFDAACIYALTRNKDEALKMLEEAASTGMPNVAAFRHDPFLKTLQGYPPYEQFMAGLQRELQGYQKEFKTPLAAL